MQNWSMQRLDAGQQELVRQNVGIVYAVLRHLRVNGAGFEDAKAEGMVALCEAAATYATSKAAFSTWAWLKVRWRVGTWMTAANRHAKELSAGDALEDVESSRDAPDEALGAAESVHWVARVVRDHRYAAEDIAAYLGVTPGAVERYRRDEGALENLIMSELQCQTISQTTRPRSSGPSSGVRGSKPSARSSS